MRLQRACLPEGVELHWVERGNGEPVLFLHGGLGDCRSWDRQLQAIAPAFRAISYSRRYSYPNANPVTAPNPPWDDVQDLHGFAQVLRLRRFHLVGTSYGALVALFYAIAHPEAATSLVLCEPPLHRLAARTAEGARLQASFMAGAWAPAAAAFRRGDQRAALGILVDAMWGSPRFCTLSSSRLLDLLRNARAMQVLTEAPDPFPALPAETLGALRLPVLLVCGQWTSPLHRCVMNELGRAIPWACRATVPRAGHAAPAENAQGFNTSLRDFLGADSVRPSVQG